MGPGGQREQGPPFSKTTAGECRGVSCQEQRGWAPGPVRPQGRQLSCGNIWPKVTNCKE